MERLIDITQDIAKPGIKLQPPNQRDEIQTLFRLISRAIKKDTALFLFVQYQNFVDAQNIMAVLQQQADAIEFIPINCQAGRIQVLAPQLLEKQASQRVFFIFNLPRQQDSSVEEIDPVFLENLNFSRDELQANRVKSIFFLTAHELSAVAIDADDFWAFRHRLLELPTEMGHFIGTWSRPETSYTGANKEEIQRQIKYRKSLLNIVSIPEKKVRLINEISTRYLLLGQYQKALDLLDQGLKISREIGNRQGEGACLGNLGTVYGNLGQFDKAIGYCRQALDIAREIGDRQNEGLWLGNLGAAYYDLGQFDKAIGYYRQGLDIAREIGDKQAEGYWLNNLGKVYAEQTNYDLALDYFQKSEKIRQEIKDPRLKETQENINKLAAAGCQGCYPLAPALL